MVGFILCGLWLLFFVRVTFILVYLLIQAILWPFRKPQAGPGSMVFHTGLVERAERTRLTKEEVARRVFALYPVREVPRSPWPRSFK